jgi:hypothetical protein
MNKFIFADTIEAAMSRLDRLDHLVYISGEKCRMFLLKGKVEELPVVKVCYLVVALKFV